jgi:glycerol-3-phosphate dehydrogenase
LKTGAQVGGVKVRDRLSGDLFEIRSRFVVNAAGPWSGFIPGGPPAKFSLAKAINVVARRQVFEKYAIGLPGNNGYSGAGALPTKRPPFFFVVPWRGRSLIGTAYSSFHGGPDDCRVSASDLDHFVEQFNRACPGTKLTLDDVCFVHGGLLPANTFSHRNGAVRLWRDHAIYDHASDGASGLLSVVGVKYTMARYVAEKLVDKIFALRGQRAARSSSSTIPVCGGKIARFEAFLDSAIAAESRHIGKDAARALVYNYGSSYREIYNYLGDLPQNDGSSLNSLAILQAQTRHAIKAEMAQKLADVVFRRTDLGTAGHPGAALLDFCAATMAAELSWNRGRTQQELQEVNAAFGGVMGRIYGGSELADPAFQQIPSQAIEV